MQWLGIGRGTAERHIKEGKYAFHWTRLPCRKFRDNAVRLQLHALAYNLATFLRCIVLPEEMAEWSLTSLQLKLIKIGASVVRHVRAGTQRLGGLIRPHSSVLTPADTAQGEKRLFKGQNQATLTSDGRPLGGRPPWGNVGSRLYPPRSNCWTLKATKIIKGAWHEA